MIADGLLALARMVRGSEELQFVDGGDAAYVVLQGADGNQRLTRIPDEQPVAEPDAVCLASLDSLIEYMSENPDGLLSDEVFLNVLAPDRVIAQSRVYGEKAVRQCWAVCEASLPFLLVSNPGEGVGKHSLAEIRIHLRSAFVQSEARDELVAFLASVVDSEDATYSDDGFSQSVVVRSGLSLKADGKTPASMDLAPYRTFHEIDQPESPFILRIDRSRDGPVAALVCGDGGAWKHAARQAVATYLRNALPGVTVLA